MQSKQDDKKLENSQLAYSEYFD